MLLAAAVAMAGMVVMALSLAAAARAGRGATDDLLELLPGAGWPPPETDGDRPGGDAGELGGLAGRASELADDVVERVDQRNALGRALVRARLPLRPGEYLIITAAAGLGVAALVLAATHSFVLALAGPVVAGVGSVQLLRRRVARRRKAFEAQLPDALGLVASSLSAGHTFLRAIQMMCEEAGPPISEEFSLVVAETRLGDTLVDSLERMSARVQVRDFDMVVQAIRIQQSVGGRLATLLHTLADFIRARGELRREVMVLTAEGRMSAYVLAGLVPFLFGVMQLLNPDYVKPLYSGWGVGVLVGCGLSVLAGMLVILRMVRIEV